MSQCDSAIEGLMFHNVIQPLRVNVTPCDSVIGG